jgi:hypothetical protein
MAAKRTTLRELATMSNAAEHRCCSGGHKKPRRPEPPVKRYRHVSLWAAEDATLGTTDRLNSVNCLEESSSHTWEVRRCLW